MTSKGAKRRERLELLRKAAKGAPLRKIQTTRIRPATIRTYHSKPKKKSTVSNPNPTPARKSADNSMHPRTSVDIPVEPSFLKHDKANLVHMYASDLGLTPIPVEQPPVPRLDHGLDRVLFNKGVYQLQDPHSRVYNFDPYLQQIMPVAEFDFNALAEYKTSSQDPLLARLAKENDIRYVGSTSSMTSTLAHFHYLLSNWRPLNLDMLSRHFSVNGATIPNSFTKINKAPNAMFLRYKNGTYAIDADKEYDGANVLMLLGKSLEKLLTMPADHFERYRKSDSREISEAERNTPDSYHFSTQGNFLMRSQLDAHDPRLPGTGMFDLKTRAVLSVRMQAADYEEMSGYELFTHHGEYESYEREFYDMLRSTMLKYSLQVRMGRMDGIYVAYHNVKRMFGFQYLTLGEMDRGLHGQSDTCLGDQEFSLSVELLNKILDKATERYPGQSLRFHFETRPSVSLPFMYIFAEPMSEEAIDAIQNSQKAKIREFERSVMGLEREAEQQEEAAADSHDSDALMNEMDIAQHEEGNLNLQDESSVMDPDTESVQREVEVVNLLDETVDVDEIEDIKQEEEVVSLLCETVDIAQALEDRPGDIDEIRTGTIKVTDWQPSNLAEGVEEPTSATYTSDDPADLDFLLSESESVPDSNVMVMTLTVRSMVNDKYVERPESLVPGDDWSIEYSLSELPPSRAKGLYEATKARRRKEFTKTESENPAHFSMYLDVLRKLAAQGRKKRAEIDERDLDREKVVFGKPYGKVDADDMSEKHGGVENVEIQGVDDYTQWLFGGQGKPGKSGDDEPVNIEEEVVHPQWLPAEQGKQ